MRSASALADVSAVRLPARSLQMWLAFAVAVAILLTFWTQQRYPALLKKLNAGTSVKVAGAISFDALLPVKPAMPPAERVLKTSVNWLWTNRFGMEFAIPFGAALMTLMAGMARPVRFGSATANVLCGAVAGAPLGVCTNCATPVAQSMIAGGASTRLTLAGMISSPSFNPVVVAMAFVLFPLPVAMMRMAAPLLLLLALPWLVPERTAAVQGLGMKGLGVRMPELAEPVATRVGRFARTYLGNLLRLTWMTLPWMLLAAVLGALAVELIPAYSTGLPVTFVGIAAVAVFGTLLPVPMALDVALAFVLYHAGVPMPYVAALICTLGPVSVYSLTAMSRQLGRATGLRLAGAVALLGLVAGLIATQL